VCTFEGERVVIVCDVAISRVRRAAERTFSDKIHYTVVDGRGTRFEAPPEVDTQTFAIEMRAAIARPD
jgi:hypothetical protein